MKQLIIVAALFAVIIGGCKSKTGNEAAGSPNTEKIVYPFRPRHQVNWVKGDDKNALIVLNCLNNYVAGDVKSAAKDFADTATFITDYFYFKGTRDSLVTTLSQVRGDMATLSKSFDAWATSYNPDTKESSVRLWYVERWTDKKGKKDSLYYTDDVLLKDGKILVYDEKVRHYAVPEIKK